MEREKSYPSLGPGLPPVPSSPPGAPNGPLPIWLGARKVGMYSDCFGNTPFLRHNTPPYYAKPCIFLNKSGVQVRSS